MQTVRATNFVALLLLFGINVPAYAQDQQKEKQGEHEKQSAPSREGQSQRPQAREKQNQKQPQEQQHAQPARQAQERQVQRDQQPAQPRQQQPTQRQQPKQPERQVQRDQQPAQPRQQQSTATQQPGAQQQRATGAQPQRNQQRTEQRPQQARQQQQPARTQQQAIDWQKRRGWVQQGGFQSISTWRQSRAQRWQSEHRTWAQRGGYGGYYIPQARFSLYFGGQHWFRMHSRPTIYMGYPQFSYSGFSFLLVDPWPEYWAENWYETDDVYIDFDDGYYLYNRRHPEVRLAITVAL